MTPSPALTELLQEHVIASLLKQERFRATIGTFRRWTADLGAGTLHLGRRPYDADVVGTESIPAQTFVWGWANPSTPQHDTAAALRRLGEERRVPELVDDREIPTATLNAGTASMIAIGAFDLDAYYLGVDGGRGVAFALRDDELRAAPISLVHFPSSFLELASVAEFDHRRAFAHYLARPLPAVSAAVEGGRAVLRSATETLSVSFDREGRVADLRFAAPGAAG